MAKKIFLLVPALTIGGQQKIAVDTAKLLASDYDVKMVVFYRHETEFEEPCTVDCLNVGPAKNAVGRVLGQIKRIRKLRKMRKEERPDIVYSFGQGANMTNVFSGLFLKDKTIIAIHGFTLIYKSIINRFVFGHCDSLICISQAMQHHLLKLYPHIKHSVVIENGYDIKKIRDMATAHAELKDGSPKFIAMGRMDPIKGFPRLLDAFSVAAKALPNATLTFVGGGEEEEVLKDRCARLGLNDRVTFAGYQKNPHAFLAKCDVFVLSSYNEGFPNALIEAMACGNACLCVDCESGPREILSEIFVPVPIQETVNEKYGVLCPNDKDDATVAHSLAEAMIELGQNPEQLRTYQKISLQRAPCFSGEVYKKKLISLFES